MDRIKSLLIGGLLGIPLIALILYFLEYLGSFAWLYAWGLVVTFSFIIQFLAPTLIMPLFNKFTPIEEGELKNRIITYCKKVKFSVSNIYKIDGSKRSSKSNAFFTGFGKTKRIALYDTLLDNHTNDEILTILSHEIGHHKKKHVLTGTLISIIHTGVVLYLMSFFIFDARLYLTFGMESQAIYAGLIFFSLLFSPLEVILGILMKILSRKNEFEADNYAVSTTNLFNEFISALKKLSKSNLSNLTPHKLNVFLNYSHPPVLERINNIKRIRGSV